MSELAVRRYLGVALALIATGCTTSVRLTAGPTYTSVGAREGFGGQVLLSGAIGIGGRDAEPHMDMSLVTDVGVAGNGSQSGLPVGVGLDVARRSPKVIGRLGLRATYTAAEEPTTSLAALIGVGVPLRLRDETTGFSFGIEGRAGAMSVLGDGRATDTGVDAMLGMTAEWHRLLSGSRGKWWGDF